MNSEQSAPQGSHPADPRRPAPYPQQNLMGLGWQIAGTLVVFTVGGYYLDRWLDTGPWLLLAGAFLGMISIFVQIFRIANDLNRVDKAKKQAAKEDNR